MLITADDVRAQVFTSARKGYDEREVDDFLDEIVRALTERDEEIDALTLRWEKATSQVAAVVEPVAPVPDTSPEPVIGILDLAQRIAADHIAAAQAEADSIRADARREATEETAAARAEAQRILGDAQARRLDLLAEASSEQHQVRATHAQLTVAAEETRSHLESYLTQVLATVREAAMPQPTRLTALPSTTAAVRHDRPSRDELVS